jgi:type IV pilus biogenesis protein CpaD/CtpE
MERNDLTNLTDVNLDRLAGFLSRELERSTLAAKIPSGAHIFHGARDDVALTQSNLQLVSKILLGMALGYVEDAPLMMVFEYEPGMQTVIDLSDDVQKDRVRAFVEGFQEQNRREMVVRINELVPA